VSNDGLTLEPKYFADRKQLSEVFCAKLELGYGEGENCSGRGARADRLVILKSKVAIVTFPVLVKQESWAPHEWHAFVKVTSRNSAGAAGFAGMRAERQHAAKSARGVEWSGVRQGSDKSTESSSTYTGQSLKVFRLCNIGLLEPVFSSLLKMTFK
jgi:hypothetical protein